ncbi:glycosyl transferase [Kaistia sp. 32K]|uniref:glycosyltransferase family 25 protein n=1 Tax=Kaistia sp. 32K TaxID=2795690 RepID=UPI0019168E8B|nr:glycosyltransferase family 25 protein [Kaistia sp. 32K]BCP53209.1 glycosyl transferase [Kaistia sp. 32K]
MRAVVINLDRSPERLALFGEQAERLGFAFERLEAVDAHGRAETRGPLSAAEIACFESHRRAWQLLVDSGEDWLAVFEDDVLLASPIARLLASDHWIPDKTDLVKLETFDVRVAIAAKGAVVEGVSLHRLQTTHCGAAGYILSRQCAIELLAKTHNFSEPVDIVMFNQEHEVCRNVRILQTVPAVCIQERFIAARAQRPPRTATLIQFWESDGSLPAQSDKSVERKGVLTRVRREVARVIRQFSNPVRLSLLFRRAIRPSRYLVVPYIDA